MEKIISGIQQIGIGVPNVYEAWKWYKENFGMDIRIFEDNTVAELMLPYTGGKPQRRHAALAMNISGGGGFEIWQYSERKPQAPVFEVQIGDLGINIAKIKSPDARKAYDTFIARNLNVLGDFYNDHFFVKDLYGNIFQVINDGNWFKKTNKLTGAIAGAIIGVSNIEKAIKVYSDILGYNTIVSDKTEIFEDFKDLPGGNNKYRRVLLKTDTEPVGSFSRLLGRSYIELVQVLDREPKKIFENRFWGDLGFIHVCFDISGMELLKKDCESKGFSFTIDSSVKHNKDNSFDMGEAAGHFSYIEDPDGTLIEFVETHKVPIMKKYGWYLNLKNRDPKKPLPNWMLNALALNKVKF
ncbi:MAG: glyoxalase [Bacteroidetes bacterium GWF2_33_16]|nr:MAG: glyoxalase [Bacteroidetes bacterium GWE2_32_14]OFY06000.1 MAG: glyoxalase [Bacteroidetes bacterium GWF2_33_16]